MKITLLIFTISFILQENVLSHSVSLGRSSVIHPQASHNLAEYNELLEPQAEVDTVTCPAGCVCQYAKFNDLPISRWINFMQKRETNHNREAYDNNDDSFISNQHIKQATCILQEESDPEQLIRSLPHDLQALILLYTGIGHNKTINVGVLKPLNQLTTLEMRGPYDRTLRVVFDEALTFLQHVNFESITLLGSEGLKRPQNPIHPSNSFNYKPKSEIFNTNDKEENINLIDSDKIQFVQFNKMLSDEEIEILPYDVYVQEVKRARMPTFYGWTHLEVLRIHSCKLSELHWEMFDGLEALQHLSLEYNDIDVVPAFALYGAAHIKTLSLAHNNIYDLHYRALAGLLELRLLDLSDNRLGKLSELTFPPFPKLERVDFRNNPIKYIFPATFWVMNRTRELLFSSKDVPLELWSNAPFESLTELKELTVENVTISSLEQNIFKDLKSLRKLKLRGAIYRLEFDAFASLPELRELDLSDCHINDISMDALMGCKKLKIIRLAHNNITYIPSGLFDDQLLLEEVYLEGNQLKTLPHTIFQKSKLRIARLSDNPWECSCDMKNWKSKITNQERGRSVEKCTTFLHTGENMICRRVDTFKFDHRHAPRCANYNGRSVFYVLRKQLQCETGRIIWNGERQRQRKRIPTWKKMEMQRGNKNGLQKEKINGSLWKARKEQKLRKNEVIPNSLEFVLNRMPTQKTIIEETRHSSEDISNEVF